MSNEPNALHETTAAVSREQVARLTDRVYVLVRACPPGRVTTYGWLAAALGYPRGARMVGWMMNEAPLLAKVPAHRVVSARGELSGSWAFGKKGLMRTLLEQEGVAFDGDGRIDMAVYGWNPLRHLSDDERHALLTDAENSPAAAVSDTLFDLLRDNPASPLRLAATSSPASGSASPQTTTTPPPAATPTQPTLFDL